MAKHRNGPSAGTEAFYRRALEALLQSDIEFLVGGAYALERYTEVTRDTHDLDVFVRPADAERTLAELADAGHTTELTFPHWLGKALSGPDMIDVIFSSGNGRCPVDDRWFVHAEEDEVFGQPVRLVAAEEMIWIKAFVMERERFDGADILHLLRARAESLDWARLVERFGANWRLLLAHVVFFGFVYPAERARIPPAVVRALVRRLEDDLAAPGAVDRLCQGTLLSREQYLVDVDDWGYTDARRVGPLAMSAKDIAHWTAAISRK